MPELDPSTALVIIDPQKGFTDDMGSLALSCGVAELTNIKSVLRKLMETCLALPKGARPLLVTSSYAPGQFTGGELSTPFSYICVPGHGIDCTISLPDEIVRRCHFFVKTETSAMSSSLFVEEVVSLIQKGTTNFVLSGFLLTSCVATTALEMRAYLPQQCDVTVKLDLCGARMCKYQKFDSLSSVEMTMQKLERAGVLFELEDSTIRAR